MNFISTNVRNVGQFGNTVVKCPGMIRLTNVPSPDVRELNSAGIGEIVTLPLTTAIGKYAE